MKAILLLVVALPLCAQPYSENPKSRQLSGMEAVLEQIARWDFDKSRAPLYEFTEFLQGRLNSPGDLREIEERLVRILDSDATLAGKDFVCRQLRVIGTAASVPALARMLLEPGTSNMARYALEGLPGNAPADALLAALTGATGAMKIGIINSLGQRRDAQAAATLAPLIASREKGVSEAAVAALASIGGEPSLEALAAGRTALDGALRVRASEAYLLCAGKLAGANPAAALRAYRQLAAAAEPETIRIAAFSGLAAAAGKECAPDLEKELGSPSPKMQAAAIRLLNAMPGPDITRLLARHYGKLPPPAQVRVVAALGDRGDGSGRAVVTEAVKSPHGSVRKAALEALAKIGDGSSVNVLAGAAAASDGVEQAAARESLYRIRGEGVEPAIVSGIAKGTGKTRLELIRAAGERGLSTAGDALAAAARDSDRLVRRESIRALRNAAGPEQAALLLGLLTRAQDETERREAARALAAALKRSEPPRIGDTVAAYRSARDLQLRAALLDVMGQVSSEEALPVLRSSLNDSHPEIARAAILALSEWLSPAPMPDLLQVARNGANPVQRVLALRGYIRLLSGPTDRSMEDMVHLLGEAMALAQQTEEKRAILSLLANYPSKEALRIADDASSDSGVAREAKAAVARIKLALGAVRP